MNLVVDVIFFNLQIYTAALGPCTSTTLLITAEKNRVWIKLIYEVH